MLSVYNLEKHFGNHTVLQGVNFVLKPEQRVALVGRNGSGKTTLLKILSGQIQADGGRVSLLDGLRLGYLEQEGQVPPQHTLYAEMRSSFMAVDQLEARVRLLEEQLGLASAENTQELMRTYDRLQNQLIHAQPELIDRRIHSILFGLGFQATDLNKLCGHFSGGWQMRAALAKLLLDLPDVLLLDEPTNHLDIEAVEWLENFLTEFSGAILLVSHDRNFLDKVCNRTIELSLGEVEEYTGNYSYYEIESARRYEQQAALYKSQQKRLEQEKQWVERFRYKASLASRVQSRLKMMQKRNQVEAPVREEQSIRLNFVPALDSGKEALYAKDLCKSYNGHAVFKSLTLQVERGQRIALIGPNGSGKSTLMRLLCGSEPPDAGKIRVGYRLALVYFAQHQAEALNLNRSVIEEVQNSAPPNTPPGQLRSLLGGLLFQGDSVFKKIATLSGGERGRVALARCLATPSNFLALDEPTNHLDLDARENLLEALQTYPGTLLMISHDRYFLEQLATQVWELHHGSLRVFNGGYAEYRQTIQQEALLAQRQAQELATQQQQELKKRATEFRDNAREARQTTKKHHWTLEALERKIELLESQLADISIKMSQPELYQDPEKAQKLQTSFGLMQDECQHLISLWEEMIA